MEKPSPRYSKLDRVVAEQRRYQAERAKTYREQALELFPWICARCDLLEYSEVERVDTEKRHTRGVAAD